MTEPVDKSGAIRERPDGGARWLALAGWLWDNGRDDEAAPVRAFWPTLRDNVTEGGVSVEDTLRQLGRHAKILSRRAREVQERGVLGSGPCRGLLRITSPAGRLSCTCDQILSTLSKGSDAQRGAGTTF